MTRRWLGYASADAQRDVCAALGAVSPSGRVGFVSDAATLRQMLRGEEPRTVSVVVGSCGEGVSDINLAAALVADGRADEVVLVSRDVTGSLRSRAAAAGIARVIDMHEATSPARTVVVEESGGEGRSAANADRAGEGGGVGDAPAERPALSVVVGQGGGASPGPAQRAVQRPALSVAASPGRPDPREEDARRVERISELLRVHAPASARFEPGARAPIVVIASGRGGVGKTMLSACFATLAATWGMDVALVDLDLCFGNLFGCFGLVQGADLARVVEGFGAEAVERAGVGCDDKLTLWGPCERPEMAETVMPLVGDLLAMIAAKHGLVLVDTSTTCTDAVAQAMQAADRLVLVGGSGQADIVSVARMSALAVRLGVARTRIVRVENRCHPRALGQPFSPRAERGLETARAFRVVDGGPDVGELAFSGQAAALCDAGDDLARTMSHALASLLVELGSLPDSDAARHAAANRPRRPTFGIFGRRREAS